MNGSQQPAPLSRPELLTGQFYAWEVRGRGWQVWPQAVELEPPFVPFIGHFAPAQSVVDDARKPTALSEFAESLRETGSQPSAPSPDEPDWFDFLEMPPDAFRERPPLVELQAALPEGQLVLREAAEQFLSGLSLASCPLSFEVVGRREEVFVQLVARDCDAFALAQQLTAYFPECVITEGAGTLARLWTGSGRMHPAIVEMGLSQEFMRPLRVQRRFEPDPLIAAIGSLTGLGEGETGLLQVLFQPVRAPWPASIMRAVSDAQGRSFLADAPEMVKLAQIKVSEPLFAAVIRVACRSPSKSRAWGVARNLAGALSTLAEPASNELIPLDNTGYPDAGHEIDLLNRQSRRSGMILNLSELVSLVHLPSASVRSEKLRRDERKTRAAPEIACGRQVVLGVNAHNGVEARVGLEAEQRVRHMYVIGATGTGKSTMLLNLIRQDIESGQGVGVLDPHGDLIDKVLGYVPEERFEDVVLLDPADEGFPVGFNILTAHSELEKILVASDLVAVFRRLSRNWGDQMNSVLANAILAFLESSRGGTLSDLRRFLVEGSFRKRFLETVQDPEVVFFWKREFPMLTGRPQAPLLTRLDTFLRPKLIRHIVAQKENRLDFGAIMNEGKIFLAKLAQGAIGEENAYLLGTLLVSKLQQLAIARQAVEERERRDFFLYIDEFQNFVSPTMASILSGARKYRLGLILAHQEMRQLWSQEAEVASAVVSNPYTRICFRLGDDDAKRLSKGFSFFEARDLQNLGIGEAVCRVERAEYDFNLRTPLPPEVDPDLVSRRQRLIIDASRKAYGRPREEVMAELGHPQQERKVGFDQPALAKEKPQKAKPKPREGPVPRELPGPARAQDKPKPRKSDDVKPNKETQPLSGRGGAQHRYLQQLVKRLAEGRGYKAVVEKEILGGQGRVDVSLERGEERVACEVSVTTAPDHELGNIQKCLAAGYGLVLWLTSERKARGRMKRLAEKELEEVQLRKVRFLLPEEFVELLDKLGADSAGSEKTVRGYRVKVQYKAVGREETESRKQAIAETVWKAMRRMKKEDS